MSTIETIGPSGCDFTTPQAWYAAHAGDITSDASAPYIGEIEVGQYPSLTMTGSTTDATHYFHLRAKLGDEFRGIIDDRNPYVDTYPKITGVYCDDDYTLFEHVASNSTGGYLWELNGTGIITDSCAAQSGVWVTSSDITGFWLAGGALARNCAAVRLVVGGYGRDAIGFDVRPGSSAYQCVAYCLHSTVSLGRVYGFRSVTGALVVRNCAAGNLSGVAATKGFINGGGSFDYNATELASDDAGVNGQFLLVPSTEWVSASDSGTNPTSVDLHLAVTSVKCHGNAGTLSGYSGAPTEDIDDDPIGSDIGIDSTAFCWPVATEWTIPLIEFTPSAAPLATEWTVPMVTLRKAVLPSPLVSEWTLPTVTAAVDLSPASIVTHWTIPLVTPDKAPHGLPLLVTAWTLPAVTAVRSATVASLATEWTIPSVTAALVNQHYVDARGVYRVFNPAVYRFYREQSPADPPEEGDTPYATSATLPATPADVFADGTWYVSMSYFNGIYDSGFWEYSADGLTYHTIVVISGVAYEPPVGPSNWSLSQLAGGVVRVTGYVHAGRNADAPDQWAIAYTTDATDPPLDTPDDTEAITPGSAFSGGGLSTLEYDLPAQVDGTVIRVRLQTRRNDGTVPVPIWVYSTDSDIQEITVVFFDLPETPLDGAIWPGTLDIEEG